VAIVVLLRATRQPVFWLLFSTVFVCGLTTNGLAGLLSLMALPFRNFDATSLTVFAVF
jgi:hypothetical protein